MAGRPALRELPSGRLYRLTCNREAMCHLLGRCVVFCGVGVFLLLYGSFNDSDRILCAGLGLIGVMVLLSILVPKLNPKKYRK